MKTEIRVNILPLSSVGKAFTEDTIRNIVELATNKKDVDFLPGDFIGYLTVNKAIYSHKSSIKMKFEDGTLYISNDAGETYPILITWVEIHELEENPDDLRHLDYTPDNDSEADLLMQRHLS